MKKKQISILNKEVFVLVFPSQREADHWKIEFINKFAKDFVRLNRMRNSVELTDSTWYFLRDDPQELLGRSKDETILPGEAIYIILDDPERKKLDTYEGV